MSKALGEFEVLIRFATVRLKEEAYGATVHREIEARTGRSIAIGAVYTGLVRLQKNGFVKATVGEPTPQHGERRKKHYEAESAGARALAQSVRSYRQMMAVIETESEMVLS